MRGDALWFMGQGPGWRLRYWNVDDRVPVTRRHGDVVWRGRPLENCVGETGTRHNKRKRIKLQKRYGRPPDPPPPRPHRYDCQLAPKSEGPIRRYKAPKPRELGTWDEYMARNGVFPIEPLPYPESTMTTPEGWWAHEPRPLSANQRKDWWDFIEGLLVAAMEG